MTTGDPLVVRGCDEAAADPDQAAALGRHRHPRAGRGAARADRLVHGAGRRVVGEAMVAFVLADAYRRKFGGDHIDDVKAARPGAYEERIGWRSVSARSRSALRKAVAHRLHGRGQDDRRPRACRRPPAARRDRRRPGDRAAARPADRAGVRRGRRGGLPGGRGARRSSSCCAAPTRARSRSAAAPSISERVRAALAEHQVVWIDVDARDGLGPRPGPRAGRSRGTAISSRGSTPSASRSTPRWPT